MKKDDKDRRRRSPSPRPTKVYLGRLTKNVVKVLLLEDYSLCIQEYENIAWLHSFFIVTLQTKILQCITVV